jgi:hypothetical protein
MRAVLVMLTALRFFRDLLGVGRMDCGVGRWRRGVLSESLSTSANARLTGVLRGVLWSTAGLGDAGDAGGEVKCVEAKRALFPVVGGGVVARCRCALGWRSEFKDP